MGITLRKSALKRANDKVVMHGIMIIVTRTITMKAIAFNCTQSCDWVNSNPLTPIKGIMGPKTPKEKVF